MLERLAAWFLNTYVAEYVGNLNTDQLSIGILSGAVELEKLILKKDALHKLRLPVEVKCGYIGKLRLEVPVRYIKSQPWVVQIDQLYMIAGPLDLEKFDAEEEKMAAQARKRAKLFAMEQNWKEEQQRGGSSWFWSSFASSFTSTIAENLQVTINDIHLRYEDPEVGGAKPLVIGMMIEQLTSQSTDENWVPQFTSGGDKSYKIVNISNISAYWDEELLGDLEGDDFIEGVYRKGLSVMATQDMMSSSVFTGYSHPTRHLVKPFSAQGLMTRNCSSEPLKISSGPRINMDIKLDEILVSLDQGQFASFISLSKAFKLRFKSQHYRHIRPKVPLQNNARIWWGFAIECVLIDIRKKRKSLSLDFALTRAKQCVAYVSAYTDHLTQGALDQERQDILDETEREMRYEEVAILRRLVMQRIEKERALAEEVAKVSTDDQRGIIGRWFPGWAGPASSGDTPASIDDSFEDIDEEELMEELGLDEDANSKLMRDRIFAQVSFSLSRGSLQLLVPEEDEDSCFDLQLLVEVELTGLSCHVDYRPRLKYSSLEVLLGGVTVYDHYQDDAVFSNLVKPKCFNSDMSLSSLQRSIKFTRTSSSNEVFKLQFIQQQHQLVGGYSLHVMTLPLEVVYNKGTISRLEEFFTVAKTTLDDQTAARISSGLMGGVDHAFLDNLTIKLDISAPHILIPRDSTNIDKPMVVVDLGHLTFENVCDSSRPESATIEDSLIISEIIDIDDDDEFMTPPSSPPSEAEAEDVDLSTPVQGEGVKASLDKSSSKGRGKGYILKLSEIQILVGDYNKLQEAFANKTKSSLHLLDQFSLLVEVQREMSQIDLIANLPLLHFHLDEDKIHTLICCFVPPNTGHTPSHSSTNVNDRSIYMSIFERSISVYKSAPTCNEGSHDDHMTQTTTKHLNTKVAHLKLLQGQMNINEVLCTISCHSRPITEVKVISMRGGMVKRPYDISGRFFIQDLFVVDRLQTHGPQFELLVSSSGHGLDVSRPCDITFGDNILGADVPYMVDVRLMSLTSLSPDHPSVMVDTQGGWYHAYDNHTHIHKLDLHCTAVDVIANQRLIVEWIALFQRSVPSYLFKSTIATSIATDAASIAAVVATTTSHSIEVSLELERLVARVVRGGRGQEEEPSKLTASIDINGLGVHGQFGSKMNIEGCLDGVKVTDLTSGNDLNVISLGSSREGRDLDMVTTMLTSYDSLKKLGDSAQFAVARLPRTSPAGYEISVSVPSILYTHSMDFIHEMELFALDFLKYFDDITGSMKTAAMGVARGLVQEKSKLADHLNRLSFSLGGVAQNHHDDDDTDDGGVASKQANRILLNVLVKSPVVVLPCGNAGLEDSFVLHLGEITVKNSFKTLDSCSLDEGEFPLTSNEWEELILKVSNVTVHSSHDSASRDWLISEIKDETPTVCGRWTKIVKETSFLFQVERAMSPEGVMTTPLKENMVDVRISCQFLSSVYLVLPNEVIEMAKTMFKNSLYKPVNDFSKGGTSGASPRKTSISTAEDHDVIMTSSENLPKLFANFKLPGLSIELKHMVGSKEKDIVFISLDNFYVRCHKTTPHHAYYELALKQVVVEDLLQSDELYRYIFSSTSHPFPFKSRSPSFLLSNSLGGMGSPVSSPQQPVHSPLTTFDPFSDTTPTPRPAETTPTAETSTDIISIKGFYVSSEHPEFNTKYNNISIHTSIAFSSLYLIINLQTWVLVFDYLGIGVPTPPTSPPEPVDIAFDDTPVFPSDGLELFSLKPDGSIYINQGGVDRSRSGSVATETSPERSDIQKGTVWGVEGKISAHVELKVPSLTVTCNKLDHPLARGTANQLTAELTMSQGNLKCCGSFGKATLIDLTETGSYYRERITTSDHSLTFDVFKFGRKDLEMVRPYDISVTLQVSSVRYLHTMRFLKEMLAFCLHFPQLLEAFQRMKAVSRGNLQYTPDRKPRILFEIDVDKPMILIPKHAFSPELMGGVIKHLTLSNKFLYDGDNGTLSHRGKGNISRVRSTPAGLESTGSDRRGSLPRKHSILDNLSKFNTDKEMIEELLKGEGPCLLDCMELILREVDVFSARKAPLGNHSLLDGYQYMFKRDEGEVLKEQVTVKLAIERNLFDDFCRAAPDLHIDGKISAVHMMLDKRQLEIIKGFVEMNLGEEIEDFEKPSSVIHDPIVQPLVATVWINFRFHVEFVGVQLEFLQWRASSLIPSSVTHSLVLFDIQLSEFTFESYSDQSKSVDFTSHAVIAHDTRYAGFPQAEKPNVFEEVLKARPASDEATPTKSLQFELHVVMTPTQTKASVLLNKLRLIGVVNLLMELKEFVIDKLPDEEEGMDSLIEEDVDFDDNLLRNVITAHINKLSSHNDVDNDTNKVDKDVKIGLSITETDLVIVEDLANSSSNAVVLKGTVVLNFRSPPKSEGLPTLHCSIDGLELFSCCVSHEDDTALSILDPVSIGIELKPVQPPQSGTHSLEVDIRQVNIRVSYNDIKLFLNILQNLQLETLRDKADTEIKHQITYTNEKIVKLLLPLGFSRTAILRVLKRNDGDINETALQLVLEEKEKQEKNDNSMKLNSLEVLMGTLNMCLIDDYLNHDVPLLELTLSTLQATNSISSVVEGKSLTTLSLDYYNRNISSWEPIIEPWKLQLMWHKISQFCTDLDTNEKPDRISLKITSPEILNINLTTSLLHLLKETQTSWLADVQIDNTTSGLSQNDKENQLLKLRNKAAGNDRSIHQGLSLLHSVRFISQSRQRSKYIPFALSNSTGLPLRFATLTSLPSKVLFTSSLQQSSSSTFNVMLKAPDNWTYVQPGEEMPFDFVSRQKIRHKVGVVCGCGYQWVWFVGYEGIGCPSVESASGWMGGD
jgi:vacuolar protein sorting-associated protein 13D